MTATTIRIKLVRELPSLELETLTLEFNKFNIGYL